MNVKGNVSRLPEQQSYMKSVAGEDLHSVGHDNVINRLLSLADMLFASNKNATFPMRFKCRWSITQGPLSGCLVDVNFIDEVMKIMLHSKSAEQYRFISRHLITWQSALWNISGRIELDYANV